MQSLRMIKSTIEINLLRRASHITAQAFQEILPKIRPNMYEYEIEALFIESFIRQRSEGFAYPPIIASGKNTCIPHYTANNQPCKKGSLLLLDIGARYAHYCADVTRVVPIGQPFNPRQKKVYHAVKHIMQQAKKHLTIGSNLQTYHQTIRPIIEEALLSLGLLTQADIRAQTPAEPAYRKYSIHSISHHLGLDTHDLADPQATFAPGMVLTVEPGIYIPKENIGIRLEDNVILREKGIEELTNTIPFEVI